MLFKSTNDFTLILISLIYVLAALIFDNLILEFLLFLCAFLNLILMRRIKFKLLILFVVALTPSILALFLVGTLFNKNLTPLDFDGIIFTHILIGNQLALRALIIALLSFMFVIHIDFEQVILFLMQRAKLPVNIGYACLAMRNGFRVMQNEFFRIRSAYKMRYLKNISMLKILFPLLVSASKYSHTLGLSLEARNLNPHKTFITQSEEWKPLDSFVLGLNIIIIFALVGLC